MVDGMAVDLGGLRHGGAENEQRGPSEPNYEENRCKFPVAWARVR